MEGKIFFGITVQRMANICEEISLSLQRAGILDPLGRTFQHDVAPDLIGKGAEKGPPHSPSGPHQFLWVSAP